MSALLFGVDSGAPVTVAAVEQVTAWAGTAPRFWARYLGDGGGAATPLSKQEAWLIHAHKIAVALVYNDIDRAKLATRQQGLDAAAQAAAQAKALGVPAMTSLYADIEYGWPLTAPWLQGWCQCLMAGGYSPGLYCGPQVPAVAAALSALRSKDPGTTAHLSLWAASWLYSGAWDKFRTVDGHRRISMPPWMHFPPGEDADQVGMWQFSGPSCDGMVDLDLLDPSASPVPRLWNP